MTEPSNQPTFGDLDPRAQAVLDRVCDEFERHRQSAGTADIDTFLERVPPPLRAQLLRELVALDVEFRTHRGEHLQLTDYTARYPSIDGAWLRQVFSELEPVQTHEMTTEDAAVPTRIGEYELCRILGQGGMGTVYLARHRMLEREVAIRLVAPALLDRPDVLRRFSREIKAAGKLVHPNLVMAFDAGVFEGRHYLVMEHVAGTDLHNLVATEGPLSIDSAVDYVVQAAHGLAYAHQQGIVHRDVKPSNLLLGSDGVVRVLDWGLVRLDPSRSALPQSELTQPNAILGTTEFMAPEQSCDPTITDHRADIYGLGCTLFYLLAGQPPFSNASPISTIVAHQTAPPPSLRVARQDAPDALCRVYETMLAKSPGSRFSSMDVTIDAFNAAGPAPAKPTTAATPWMQRRSFMAALVGGTLGVAGVTAWGLWGRTNVAARHLDAPFDEATAKRQQLAWANHLGVKDGPTFRNSLGMALILIPPGRYFPGTDQGEIDRLIEQGELSDHANDLRTESVGHGQRVHIEQPFWVGQTEVTVEQYRQFTDAQQYTTEAEQIACWGLERGQWTLSDEFSWRLQGDRHVLPSHPVSNLLWSDAIAFCEWLSRRESTDGRSVRYRLPREIEWEYACRAGSQSAWFWGDDAGRIGDYAWYADNAGGEPQPVGQRAANGFGLHDMLGNEMEWCQDSLTEGRRVLRGGSFFYGPHLNRCASRRVADLGDNNFGTFRVVLKIADLTTA